MDRVRQRGRRADRERGGDDLDRQVAEGPAAPGAAPRDERRLASARLAVAAAAAILVALGTGVAAYRLHGERGRDASFALLAGFAFGAILQRSRLCFASAFRELFVSRDRRVALGVLAALAVGSLGYQVVFGAQVPDPTRGYVPPAAFITRVSWHTLLGGVAFGVGMVIAGGCISGQMYRLGEGAGSALVALAGVVVGQVLAQLAWNPLWVGVVADAPVVWLPKDFGYAGSLLLQLAVIGALAAVLLRFFRGRGPAPSAAGEPAALRSTLRRVFREPWPAVAGGAAIGVLATLAFLRGAPLGVTAELARLSRAAGDAAGILPERLEGLDVIGGCRPPESVSGLSNPGLFVVALVAGALAAALAAGEFRPRLARPRALLLALLGGALTGFGAFVASGCTVGALLSGVMAFSLHGWVFAGGLAIGAFGGTLALRHVAPKPAPVLDLRGESCGMPAIRLSTLLERHDPGAPFLVFADDPLSLEPLLPIAASRGFTGRVEPTGDGTFKVAFEPALPARVGAGAPRP